ncbi:permease prefix domain 1-containing protein [Microbacterium sp.]|uniref:permease prefix domain 1-containing protein n=1 Tax=Microbacterium sp. TaxID=51671 RepID=UPI0039E3989D
MNPTVIDRYVDTAMRTVPEKQRADLSAELRTLIADQVDARVESGEAPDAAESAVLTGLGDPDQLAAGYTGRPLHLIGPRYFLTWRRLLRALLWIVLPCVTIVVTLGAALSGAGPGEIAGAVAVALGHAVVHIGFWTTLVFAIIERATPSDRRGVVRSWTVDDLPEPRLTSVSAIDVVGAVLLRVGLAGYLLFDHFVLPTLSSPNIDAGVSLFAAGLWPGWLMFLFVVMALDIALVIVVCIVGRWTPALATVRAVLTTVAVVPAIWLLVTGRLINPETLTMLQDVPDSGVALTVMTVVTAFGLAAVAAWHTYFTFSKARR